MTRCANSPPRSRSGSARCRPSRERAGLVAEARALEAAVARKAPPAEVDRLARALGRAAARRLSGAARARRGARSRRAARGSMPRIAPPATAPPARADTPMARGIDPPPIAFADRDRARERSLFALYQVIEPGPRRHGDAELRASCRPQDRWALAFHVGRFAYPDALAGAGRAALGRPIRRCAPASPISRRWSALTPAALAARVRRGEGGGGHRLSARRSRRADRSAAARSRWPSRANCCGQSLAAYRRGERDRAGELALAAYLDGFEPVEAVLGARDGGLVAEVERGDGRAARRDRARRAGRRRRARGSSGSQALFGRAEARARARGGQRRLDLPRRASPSCCARGWRRC